MLEGISFIIRVRDEEAILAQSLQSLEHLTIPHDVVVILHRCTDNSRNIALRHHATSVLEYPHQTSRAGLETLITPVDWPQSLSYYYNYCFQQSRRQWMFKWDADFIASRGLIDWLNSRRWLDQTPTRIYINARTPHGHDNCEPYLFNIPPQYSKYVFWEYNEPLFRDGVEQIHCPEVIEHISDLTVIKPYWKQESWFANLNTPQGQEMREKMSFLIESIGSEPIGAARAGDPECEKVWHNVMNMQDVLNQRGINLWK